jgi:pimeloyl-ACP methyl ester carboxylesterase
MTRELFSWLPKRRHIEDDFNIPSRLPAHAIGVRTHHQEQADLYAARLDTLGLRRVIVQGSSGGSYSAIQFVLRHPDRALALILYAPDLGSHQVGDTFAVRLHAASLADR